MNARYYDPETGRFISQDTDRGEDDDADTWHLYAYCANNPINYTDPSGHLRQHWYTEDWFVAGTIDLALCGITGLVKKGAIKVQGDKKQTGKNFKINIKKS